MEKEKMNKNKNGKRLGHDEITPEITKYADKKARIHCLKT